ncbi:unnamed protein product [Mytilus edulis]|uniref:Uncharacterized protein n=1 Tax=Mytilus edulis TaxID=6550 RepID=A0A8S3SQM3_MYTED|nr:unnamed protein product [Mytilus edulis]
MCQSVTKYKDAMAIVNDSLCSKGPEKEYNKLECIERKCEECGVKSLKEKIAHACKDHNTLTWERWENRKTTVKGTTITKKDLVSKKLQNFYQDEIQAAHWQYQQISVHPIVAYYKCPEKECKDTSLVTEIIVCISDDLTHDTSAVNKFFQTAFEHLQKSVKIKHAVQFTDGCSAQYKSKEPFMDLSYAETDYNFETERIFLDPAMGRDPAMV